MLEVRHPTGATERIAWHLLTAGDDRDALVYLLRAADDRVERGDLDVAERILDERAAAVRRVSPSPDDPVHGAGWFLRLRILRIMGRVDEAQACVAQAIEAARQHGWTSLLAEARIHQGILTHRRGAFVHAWRRLRQGEELAQEASRDDLVAASLFEQARLLIERGRLPDATGRLNQARALFVQLEDATDQANCDVLLGRVAKQKGDLDKAMAHFTDALEAFEQAGSRWGVASCTNELGEVARLQGDLTGAAVHYRDACAKMEELGADDANVMRVNVGLVLIFRSRFSQAEPLLERALRNFAATNHKGMVGITHAMLLCCAAARQDWAGWDAHADAAVRKLTETGWVEHDIALAARLAGDLAAALGEVTRARDAWNMALLQWKVLDRPDEVASVQRRLQAED
jgi:tetratricopeptide (TPR) repeat protein